VAHSGFPGETNPIQAMTVSPSCPLLLPELPMSPYGPEG
jgi:hypothetical protein